MRNTITLENNKYEWENGESTFYKIIDIEGPEALHFALLDKVNIHRSLTDVAQIRYEKAMEEGRDNVSVVCYYNVHDNIGIKKPMKTSEGEYLISEKSITNYILRKAFSEGKVWIRDGIWHFEHPNRAFREEILNVIDRLRVKGYIKVYNGSRFDPINDDFDGVIPSKDIVGVANVDVLSDVSYKILSPFVFNTSFFTMEEGDIISHNTNWGEAYGLLVDNGNVILPPLYNRGAFLIHEDNRCEVARISMKDTAILFPHGKWLKDFAVNKMKDISIYTRYFGVKEANRTFRFTPEVPNRYEFCIVGKEIRSYKIGGNLEIPQNGFIVSLDGKYEEDMELSTLIENIQSGNNVVEYILSDEFPNVYKAIQGGTMLLKDGKDVLTPDILEKEEFFPEIRESGIIKEIGVVPTIFPADVDETKAARIAIGYDNKGEITIIVVEGSNKTTYDPRFDSAGMTLKMVTGILKGREVIGAINLDGGGSTSAFYLSGSCVKPADRRNRKGVFYERPVPAIGYVMQGKFNGGVR